MAPKPKPAKSKSEDAATAAAPKISVGFALMSLVPILLTLYLVAQPGGAESIPARKGIILGLMVASAISGFLFIRAELARILGDVVRHANKSASGDLRNQLRAISQDEIARISGTIEQITSRFEDGNEQAERMKARLREGLSRLADGLQHSADVDGLIRVFTESAREAAEAQTAYFVGIDEDAGDFVTLTADGESADEVRNRRVPLGEGVPGLAARERAPLLLHDLDPKGKAGLGLTVAPTSTIAAPLHVGDTLLGVLILHDRADGARFEEDDVAVIASLSILASSAMAHLERSATLEYGLDQLIRSFALAIESRDPYARGHAGRVALYCDEMGRALRLDEETIRSLRRAAYLHGIGRVGLPETLLRKETEYTEDELEHVRAYPARSEDILKDVEALAPLAPMIRNHLEAVDGSGPNGLTGDDIPLTTHILIVANAFDSLTSDKAYRQAYSLSEAFKRLQEGAGKQYDRRAVRALMELDEKILKGSSGPREPVGAVRGQGNASISVME